VHTALKELHRPKTSFGNEQKTETMKKQKYQACQDRGDNNRARREPLL